MFITEYDKTILGQLREDMNTCPKCRGLDPTCECRKAYFFEVAKMDANIPFKYRRMGFDQFHADEVCTSKKKIVKYVQHLKENRELGNCLYLHGGTGSGKGALACLVLMEALKAGFSAYYVDINAYMDSRFSKNKEDETDEDKADSTKIDSVDFLLVDNVGDEIQDAKGYKRSWLMDLVRKRTNHLMPMLMVTQKTQNHLFMKDAALKSLVQEHFLDVEFTNGDFRQKIKENHEEKERNEDVVNPAVQKPGA